jgi:hypothetical protein
MGCLLASLLHLFTPGCSYESLGPIDQHYRAFSVRMPEHNTVSVCSAYDCRKQTACNFTAPDIAKIGSLMAEAKRGRGAAEERRRIARTLAWMERRVGDVVGTPADRPGDDLMGAGDPTQMDCVDVATNLTSYLVILERNKLLKYHAVGSIYVKEDMRQGISGWTHYAAIIVEHKSAHRYAVDGWKLASGQEPEIVEAEKWYIDDADIVLKALLL